MNKEGKCIILSRVSTDGQDLEQQTESVRKLCLIDGFSDGDIIVIEDKESAVLLSEEERNGLNEMKEVINGNPGMVKCVYAYEISRISRRSEVNYSIRNFLRDNRVQLKICVPMITVFDDEFNVKAEANLMYSLFNALAENEGYIRKARMKRGKDRNKKLGLFNGGKVLYGYKTDEDGRFIIDEDESGVVKRIYSMYCSGFYSTHDISDLLWNEGIIKQGLRRSRDNFVRRILNNDNYIGNDVYPKIISEDEYNVSKRLLNERVNKPRRCYNGNVYFGHKLLYVKGSGRGFIIRKSDCLYKEDVSGYCVNANVIDSLLLYCADYAYKNHSKSDYEKLVGSYNKDLKSCLKRLDNYDIEEKKIKDSLDKLEERIIIGIISDKKADEIQKKLLNDIKNIVYKRTKDENLRITLENILETIQEESGTKNEVFLDVYDMDEKGMQDFIRKEIERVEIFKKNDGCYLANIKYKNPLIDSQIYEVIPRKHKVKLYGEYVDDFKFIMRFNRK